MRERFCKSCGGRLGEAARYCKHCGAPASGGQASFLSSPWFLIFGGAVLAAILLFSGVRMVDQLTSGAFPRAGFYVFAGVTLVVTTLAFLLGRLWAMRAAGLDGARYRRARFAGKASAQRYSRRVARPVLLAVCLLIIAAAVFALLLNPAAPSETAAAATGAETAEVIADSDGEKEQTEAIPAENNSIVKINGICSLYTMEMSGANYLERFVYFDDEKAVSGTCVAPPEVAVKLMGEETLHEVTLDATYDYEVTGVSFIDVRGLDQPYISSMELTLRDQAGMSQPFTATFNMNHSIDFSNCPNGGMEKYQFPLSPYKEITFTYDPEAIQVIATLPVPEAELYGIWIASDSLDTFSNYDVHSRDDIPFLFFYIDTMYVGLCSSAANARDVLLSPYEAAETCTILAQYPFTIEYPTYALRETGFTPIIDTCWITVQLDEMAAMDLLMEEGSVVMWENKTYEYSQGVEWSAPW